MKRVALITAAAAIVSMPAQAADYAFDAQLGCNAGTCVFGFYNAPSAFTFADGDTILLSGTGINLSIDPGRRLGGIATLGTRFGFPAASFSGAPITATIKLFDGNDALLTTGAATLSSNASVSTPGRSGLISGSFNMGAGPITPTRFEALFVAEGGGVVNLSTIGVRLASSVPEPASWAMMIAGFAVVGSTARRIRKTDVRFA